MKFTIAASYLIVLASAFAVLSTEATSLRKKESPFQSRKLAGALQPTTSSTNLRRRLEENADGDENEAEDEDGENNDEAEENEDADEAEEGEEDEEEEDGNEDQDDAENDAEDDSEDNAEGDSEDDAEDDASEEDDYVFYDDEAIQNCEEDDEDCEKAAAYAAYDEEDLANCEEDDEECNEAAAYMEAKNKQEEEASTTKPWNYENYSDMYDKMSRTSQIWTIVLIIWFALLGVFTSYLCCCRKGYASEKKANPSLGEALMDEDTKEVLMDENTKKSDE